MSSKLDAVECRSRIVGGGLGFLTLGLFFVAGALGFGHWFVSRLMLATWVLLGLPRRKLTVCVTKLSRKGQLVRYFDSTS